MVKRGWHRYVGTGHQVDRTAYVFYCMEQVQATLRRRDLFIAPSMRYSDVRLGLLSGSAGAAARPTVCRSLGLS